MKSFLKIMLWAMVGICIVIAASGAVLWYLWSSNLPYIGTLREYNPSIITEVFSNDDQVIGRFSNEKRIVISLDQVPEYLIEAFVAADMPVFLSMKAWITKACSGPSLKI